MSMTANTLGIQYFHVFCLKVTGKGWRQLDWMTITVLSFGIGGRVPS